MNYLVSIESITLNDSVFCVPSRIYINYVTIGILLIISIILLATAGNNEGAVPVSKLLDSEEDYQERLKKRQSPSFMNLSYKRRPGTVPGSTWFFVFDKYDITGSRLTTLFLGRNYELSNFEGSQGYILHNCGNRVVTGPNGTQDVRVNVLAGQISALENRGVLILSGGQRIDRVYNAAGGTALLVKNN